MRHGSLFQENIKRLWRFSYGGYMPASAANSAVSRQAGRHGAIEE